MSAWGYKPPLLESTLRRLPDGLENTQLPTRTSLKGKSVGIANQQAQQSHNQRLANPFPVKSSVAPPHPPKQGLFTCAPGNGLKKHVSHDPESGVRKRQKGGSQRVVLADVPWTPETGTTVQKTERRHKKPEQGHKNGTTV